MQRRGIPAADACRAWLTRHVQSGVRVVVPEIADYEVRRELLRLAKTSAVLRLDAFNHALPDRYLPLTTSRIRLAAELWADIRRRGLPTADPKELDGDVIVAAQAMTLAAAPGGFVVATTNVVHLSRFVPSDLWGNI